MNVKLTFSDAEQKLIEWRFVQDDGDNIEFEIRRMITKRTQDDAVDSFSVRIEGL